MLNNTNESFCTLSLSFWENTDAMTSKIFKILLNNKKESARTGQILFEHVFSYTYRILLQMQHLSYLHR